MDISLLDPMAKAFYKNDGLEIAQRVGLALKEGAKTVQISFNRWILPSAFASFDAEGSSFSFPEGMRLSDHGRLLFPEANIPFKSHTLDSFTRSHAGWGGDWGGHSNPDFGRLIEWGTEGIRERIQTYRLAHPEAEAFYQAAQYAMDALDILGERFEKLAKELAAECEDPLDRKRLELAAKAFQTVPKKPAYDMNSAGHAFWLLFTFDGIDSPGRFDQYMKRVYEAPQSREEAEDMLERLWDSFHDTRAWNLCLSGSNENWEDQSNELTYDILRLAAQKKYQTPNITLRVHRNTPERLWNAIYETLASGIGMPALYNDETLCPALEQIGIPPEHSHLYCMNGCNQVDIMGKSHMGLEDGEVSFAKCLEYALHNGVNQMTGQRESVESGDASSFETYDALERAFFRQLDYVTYHCCMGANAAQHMRAVFQPNPLRSCLIEGCLEKGVDYRNGGPLYNHGQILAETIADAGDSLWAIKKLVFIEKKYTMAELISALKADFEGYDELYRDFSSCEKFGNDSDEADGITAGITDHFFSFLKRNRTYRGGVFTGGCSPFIRAPENGRCIAALPNGKHKGDPLVTNCIGATPGCDVKGPTALLKSALRYNQTNACSGFILMVKFDKKIFVTARGKNAFQALAKAYFSGGGQQLTVTVVDPEELLDAKVHPDRHRDLIVRVGGYSDYFVDLPSDIQDNIIARTFIEI